LLMVIVAFQVRRARLPGEEIVPAGYRRNVALYVVVRDGMQIAVDVWIPHDLAARERVPVLICTTLTGVRCNTRGLSGYWTRRLSRSCFPQPTTIAHYMSILRMLHPEGAVTYITEGEFRLVNRKIANGPLPYIPLGPQHSFLRSDAEPLVPVQPTEVAFWPFPTSVVLNKGHRIRLAIAGAKISCACHHFLSHRRIW
jgi:predicted acyl esterase